MFDIAIFTVCASETCNAHKQTGTQALAIVGEVGLREKGEELP